MIKREIELFNQYVNQFNKNIDAIKMKYNHTLRVVMWADAITDNILDNDLKKLSLIGALLHDIARFNQWTEYNTYEDSKSFDHGDKGFEILIENNYIGNYVNGNNKDIILNAVAKHNKKDLALTGDYNTDFVAKVVRDADKIDILINQYNLNDINKYLYKSYLNEFGKLSEEQFNISDILLDDIINHRLCLNKNVKYYFDAVLRELAFIFDLNFKKSFEIIKKEKIIDTKIALLRTLNKKEENIDKINIIEEILNEFVKGKLKED